MSWFFILVFITFDGLETHHLEGPYQSKEACQIGMRAAGAKIPEWVEKASAMPCEAARVLTAVD